MVYPPCLVAIILLCTVSFGSSVIVTWVQGGVNTVSGWRPSRLPFEDFAHAGAAFDFVYSLASAVPNTESIIAALVLSDRR